MSKVTYLAVIGEQEPTEHDSLMLRPILTSDATSTLKTLQQGNPRCLEIVHNLRFTKEEAASSSNIVKYIEIVLSRYKPKTEWFCIPKHLAFSVFEQVSKLQKAKTPLEQWKLDLPPQKGPIVSSAARNPKGSKIQVDEKGELYVGDHAVLKTLAPQLRQILDQYSKTAPPEHNIISLHA